MRLALDLDGTLVTCEPRQSAVLAAVSGAARVRVDVGGVWERKRCGASTQQALELADVPSCQAHALSASWRAQVEQPGWLALDSLQPSVRSVMERWLDRGWSLHLVTARSRREWLPVQLRHLGLVDWFQTVSCVPPSEASAAKARVLAALGCHWFIGDTEVDAAAARTAGAKFIAVSTGQRSPSWLLAQGILCVVDDLDRADEAIAGANSPSTQSDL